MRTTTTTVFGSNLFQLGVFRAEPSRVGEVRESIALSHLIALPRRSGVVRRSGFPDAVAGTDAAVYYNKGCEYQATVLGDGSEETWFIRVEASALVEAVVRHDPAAADRPEAPFRMGSGPVAPEHFRHAAELMTRIRRAELDTLETDEALAELVRAVIDHGMTRRPASERATRKSAADFAFWTQRLLAERFRENLSLGEIAEKIGASPFFLCRAFRFHVGMTMHQYRETLRLRQAMIELAESRQSLALIGLRLGYSTQSHFTSSFGRHFGISPGAARLRLKTSAA